MDPIQEDEGVFPQAPESDAGDGVTKKVTSRSLSPLSMSDLQWNSQQDLLSEEPLASGFGDLGAPSPPSPFNFDVSSSELDMIQNSIVEVRQWYRILTKIYRWHNYKVKNIS